MTISMSEYSTPRFIRISEGATLSRDDRRRFDAQVYGGDNMRAWRQQPTVGYNSSHPLITPLKINLNTDGIILPPSAR